MDEHLPAAHGIADPAAWLGQVARRLAHRRPDTPPCWHVSPTGQGMLTWHTTTAAGDALSIWLWATPTAVAIRVWHSAWQGVEVIGHAAYQALLTTIATTLIDQESDPADPPIQLQIPPRQLRPQF
jgi:hypothetical protein